MQSSVVADIPLHVLTKQPSQRIGKQNNFTVLDQKSVSDRGCSSIHQAAAVEAGVRTNCNSQRCAHDVLELVLVLICGAFWVLVSITAVSPSFAVTVAVVAVAESSCSARNSV